MAIVVALATVSGVIRSRILRTLVNRNALAPIVATTPKRNQRALVNIAARLPERYSVRTGGVEVFAALGSSDGSTRCPDERLHPIAIPRSDRQTGRCASVAPESWTAAIDATIAAIRNPMPIDRRLTAPMTANSTADPMTILLAVPRSGITAATNAPIVGAAMSSAHGNTSENELLPSVRISVT